jgi:hypothetical protein
MAIIYVARSKTLSDWGASVGISKHLFKVGTAEGDGKQAIVDLNEQVRAGADDWKLVKADDAEELTETDVLERLAAKVTVVDPNYYPRIKREPGIFRIKIKDVENSMIVARAIANVESLNFTVKPPDIGTYLIKNARR